MLVTGVSSDIGQGVAAAFAKAGADHTILSSTDSIHEAAAGMHGTVQAIKCDISDASAVTEALANIKRVDILVNNAGLERPTPLSGNNPAADPTFERIIAIDVNGTRNVTYTLNRAGDKRRPRRCYVLMLSGRTAIVTGDSRGIAFMVAFLAGPESKFITGQCFGVNGGSVMQ